MHKATRTSNLVQKLISTLAVLALGAGGVLFFAPQVNATGNVTITFDANPAMGTTGAMPQQVMTSGVSTALSLNQFTRPGYTFAGWATAAITNNDWQNQNYSGLIADGASVSYEADTTLFARWQPSVKSGTSDPVFFLEADMNQSPIQLRVKESASSQVWISVDSTYLRDRFPIPIAIDQIIRFEITIPDGYKARLAKAAQFEPVAASGGAVVDSTHATYHRLNTSGSYNLIQRRTNSQATFSYVSFSVDLVPNSNDVTDFFTRSFPLGVMNAPTPSTPPDAPTDLSATVTSSTSVALSWTPSTTAGVTHTLSSNPNSGITCTVSTASAGTCTGSFVQGQQYTFSVVASSGGTNSSAATATATPNPNPSSPPSPPSALTVSGTTSSSIGLSWSASATSGVTYEVEISPSVAGASCTVTGTTANCTGAFAQGQQYTLTLVAKKEGQSSSSVTATSTPNPGSGSGSNGNGGGGSASPGVASIPTPTLNIPATGSNGSTATRTPMRPGQNFAISGSGLAAVNEVRVGNQRATITNRSNSNLGIRMPRSLPAGVHDLTVVGTFGSVTQRGLITVKRQRITQTTIGFAGNSPVLNPQVRSGTASFLKRFPGQVSLVCIGSTSNTRVTAFDRALATQRAKRACDFAKEQNPRLQTSIRIEPASGLGPRARNVRLILKNY